ncbi:MAG: hypothetical protein ACQCN3_03650 [Candidatus Bathyarchaeia archaeon]
MNSKPQNTPKPAPINIKLYQPSKTSNKTIFDTNQYRASLRVYASTRKVPVKSWKRQVNNFFNLRLVTCRCNPYAWAVHFGNSKNLQMQKEEVILKMLG